MRSNLDICHLLISANDIFTITIDSEEIYNSRHEKPLGLIFDIKLKFTIKKTSNTIHVLVEIAHFMSLSERRSITQAFVNAQFKYCLLA